MAVLRKIGFRLFLIVFIAIASILSGGWLLSNKTQELIVEGLREDIKDVTDTAMSAVQAIYDEVQAGRIDEASGKTLAKQILTGINFGETGYFFTFDEEMTVVAHGARADLVGTNQADSTDADGRFIFQEMLAAAQNGGGFIEYSFTKPGEDGTFPKLGYAEIFEPWGWVIGTGNYLDVIDEFVHEMQMLTYQVVGISTLLMAVVSLLLARSITGPMSRLRQRMETLSQGDVDGQVPDTHRVDEVGEMANALEIFRAKLQETNRLEAEARKHEEEATAAAAREQAVRKEADQREAEERRRAEADEQARADADARRAEDERRARDARARAEHDAQEKVVGDISKGLKALADGNLALRLTDPFEDAYDQIRLDFNDAADTLEDLLKRVSREAEALSDSSRHVTDAANEAADQGQKNAASLEEAAAAINEISTSVAHAADAARHVSERAKDATATTEAGQDIVSSAVTAMHGIAQSSEKISSITDVIEDIAFQTNLLALNAGVEAARAGEEGRGFAVVASEVRSLAQRASNAAGEIRVLIEASSQKVDDGVKLVDSTGSSLKEIADAVTHMSQEILGITQSSDEQSKALSTVNDTVATIDQASRIASSSLRDVNTSCVEMASSCEKLRERLAVFDGGKEQILAKAS